MKLDLLSGVVAVGLLTPGVVAAQVTDPADSSGATPVETAPVDAETTQPAEEMATRSGSRLVEEIVVTAQKREENIQDVPISIAAYSAEALEARGAFDTKALPAITSAMSITEFGGFSFIFIRGVGSDAFVPSADPSVTTYVDGIFVPTSQGFSTDFGGVQRVEVLKGPQGTLFGRNSTGGAISVVTKKPGGAFEGSLQGTVGNYDDRRIKAYLNVPITDTIGVSVDGLIKDYDSQYKHQTHELIGQSNKEIRVKASWQALEDLNFTAAYYYSKQHSVGSSISKNIKPGALFSPVFGGPDPDDYVAETDFDGVTYGHSRVFSTTTDWKLPWFQMKFITADQILRQTYTSYDFDGTDVPLVSFDTYGQFTQATTYELQFLSHPDGWLGENFQWVVGGYFLDGQGGFPKIYLRPGIALYDYILDDTLPLPDPLLNALSPLLDPLNTAGEPNLRARGAVDTDSKSAFAQITWLAADWLDLTAGARYTDERRSLSYADTAVFLVSPDSGDRGPGHPPSGTEITVLPFGLQSNRKNNLSTRLSASFKPADGHMVYASRSTGFKSSTYNVINIYLPPNYVKPEKVTSYELGMKSDFFGGAMRFNAAIFENRIKDKQAAFLSLLSGGAVELLNAEKATVKGVEFDTVILPFPSWNPDFVFTANGAYLDAKYDKYENGKGYNDAGAYDPSEDFSGQRIERTPKWSGGTGINQTFHAGANSDVEAGVDVYYTSKIYFSAENKSDYQQKAYSLLNGRVSYRYRPWDIRLTLYGKNLLDEKYHIALFQTDFGILSTLAYGEQYGLILDWKFQ